MRESVQVRTPNDTKIGFTFSQISLTIACAKFNSWILGSALLKVMHQQALSVLVWVNGDGLEFVYISYPKKIALKAQAVSKIFG